ncbi:MAG: hypothetical protein A2166_05890 [Omnitrophica WOR_2 bacterium RBG_13_41_10]|nr:MAG: hypothetical protein A2166_05890 [Omnitrophica WOR_2 bacterium RBG_13_41_10]
MTTKKVVIITVTMFSLFVYGLVFAQEQASQEQAIPEQASQEQVMPQPGQPTQVTPAQEMDIESETQWVWGEVVSVDAAAKTIKVKYFDYDSDTEKEINVAIDEKTIYENVKSIDEIKPKDTLSMDYIIGPEGNVIAKNISVEKTEGVQTPLPEEMAPSTETGVSTTVTGQ